MNKPKLLAKGPWINYCELSDLVDIRYNILSSNEEFDGIILHFPRGALLTKIPEYLRKNIPIIIRTDYPKEIQSFLRIYNPNGQIHYVSNDQETRETLEKLFYGQKINSYHKMRPSLIYFKNN